MKRLALRYVDLDNILISDECLKINLSALWINTKAPLLLRKVILAPAPLAEKTMLKTV